MAVHFEPESVSSFSRNTQIEARELIQGLSQDFELSLNGRSQ
jgi:hypothetical protein